MNKPFLFLLLSLFILSSCAELELASHVTKQTLPPTKSQGTFKVGTPYKIDGKKYYPREDYELVETGIASWYGPGFHGKSTANGETFDKNELTAAHRTLQMPSLVRVTNLDNGRSLIVRVNDRGPYKRGRIIDVSERAAELLGFKSNGTAKVKIEVLKQESLKIAQAAKSGVDTGGFEVALNRGQPMPAEPVTSKTLITPPDRDEVYRHAVPGHMRGDIFYPDPVVTETTVMPSDIFVQAGSFTVAENAYRLADRLGTVAPAKVMPVLVDNRQFYRVRLGPVLDVAQADSLLARVIAAGSNDAIIVVE